MLAQRSQPKVLVVDDEPQLRELLTDALSDLGVQLHVVASGSEAIRHAMLQRPDLLVTDLYLGDCSGMDVIDSLREHTADLPAVVITGHRDPETLAAASRTRPVELMTKPLDLDRLRATVQTELRRQEEQRRSERRTRRLRHLAKRTNQQRRTVSRQLETTCADLTDSYRSLGEQMAKQQAALDYHRELLAAKNDDDVFRALFRLFVQHSGVVFGAALVCNADAELQMAGRFGVPQPDSAHFCRKLADPVIDRTLRDPRIHLFDATDHTEEFPEDIRQYLVGVTILAIPLLPEAGEMIGVVVLYRKGEQPFTDADLELAEMVAPPTAIAVRRND